MTLPQYVLAHAVETAQRTASEIVAEAVRAAERAGYERGLSEAPKAAPAAPVPSDALRALLVKATELVAEIEQTGSSIDGYCDDLTVTAKRRGRRVETITVPESGDSFSDVDTFLSDHGGKDLVSPDDIEVDADELRNLSTVITDQVAKLNEALDEIRALLTGEEPNGIVDTSRAADETPAQRDARVGVITKSHADDVSGAATEEG